MGRKCSHCGNIGHNSRTCTNYRSAAGNEIVCGNGGVRLFGVQVDIISSSNNNMVMGINSMKKSFSMDCLHYSAASTATSSSSSSSSSSSTISINDHKASSMGYLSDGLIPPPPHAQERKKGVPWTEEEHRRFLIGLEKLGKGDWRGISRNYVTSRTPTQVASHAQKYFLRHSTNSNSISKSKSKPKPAHLHNNNLRRRSSLFDIMVEEVGSRNNISNINILKQRSSQPKPHLLDLTSSSPSSDNIVNVSAVNWVCGLMNSLNNNNNNNTNALLPLPLPLPDLELKLAAGPRSSSSSSTSASASASNLEQSPPLVGPIRVTS